MFTPNKQQVNNSLKTKPVQNTYALKNQESPPVKGIHPNVWMEKNLVFDECLVLLIKSKTSKKWTSIGYDLK